MTTSIFMAGVFVGALFIGLFMRQYTHEIKAMTGAEGGEHSASMVELAARQRELEGELARLRSGLGQVQMQGRGQGQAQGQGQSQGQDAMPAFAAGKLSSTLVINDLEYTFLYGPTKTAIDLAAEFCRKLGASLGFTEETFGACVRPIQAALEGRMTERRRAAQTDEAEPALVLRNGGTQAGGQGQGQGQTQLQGQMQQTHTQAAEVDAQGSADPVRGIRRITLDVNDVAYVFEYLVDMAPEFAGPRLAREFCYSDKGLRLVTPLSAENALLSGEERDALVRQELEERCVKPLTAELIAAITRTA